MKSRVAQYAKTAAEEQRAFWEKNARLNRPMSPHLTIYRLPMNANLSVGHRVTGAAMSGSEFSLIFT
jgi:succinate dehydrogenase (ubiquinone) cytochrome b560 subunit